MNEQPKHTTSQSESARPSVADLLLSSSGEASAISEQALADAMASDDDVRATASMLALLELVGAETENAEAGHAPHRSPLRVPPRWFAMAACLAGLIGGVFIWSNWNGPTDTPPPTLVRISLPPVPSTHALFETSDAFLLAVTTTTSPLSIEPRTSTRLTTPNTSWLEGEQVFQIESGLKTRTWR